MKKQNQEKGITLIALVITIIVLLILAGITLNSIMGDDGILSNAKLASEKTKEEEFLEEVKLKIMRYKIEVSANNAEGYLEEVIEDFEYVDSGTDSAGDYDIFTYKNQNVKAYYDNNGSIVNVELFERVDIEKLNLTKVSDNYAINRNGLLYSLSNLECLNDDNEETLYGVVLKDISVASARYNSNETVILADSNGKVWTCGDNEYGQLGNGTFDNVDTPICISDIEGHPLNNIKIRSVSISYGHVLAIDENYNIWAWGDNTYGQLGNDNDIESNLPICITEGKNLRFNSVSAGTGHSVAIDSSGNVWAWGKNDYGQVGNNSQETVYIPVCINTLEDNPLSGITISKIVAGRYITAAIDSDGNLWTWGRYTGSDSWGGTNTPQPTPECINNVSEQNIVFSDLVTKSDILILKDNTNNLYGLMILNWNYIESGIIVNDTYTSLFPRGTINLIEVYENNVNLIGYNYIVKTDGNIDNVEINLAQ